jgi:hypothetical protein
MRKLAVAIFCCALLASPRASAQTTWSLSQDLGNASNQISFNEGSNQVWYFMESDSRMHDPTLYRFLSKYLAPCVSTNTGDTVSGLGCWQGTESHIETLHLTTEVAWNFTNTTLDNQGLESFGGYLPQTMLITATWDRYAMVAWRSPITGFVTVNGIFGWRNLYKADEVDWFVDKGNQTLKSGVLWGSQPRGLAKLSRLAITQGEVLYFIVDDINFDSNYSANPVDLRLSITQVQ